MNDSNNSEPNTTTQATDDFGLAAAIPGLALPTRPVSEVSNDLVALERDLADCANNDSSARFVAEKLLVLRNTLSIDAAERRAATDAIALQCRGQFHCNIEQLSSVQREQHIGTLVRLIDELVTAYALAYAALHEIPQKISAPFDHARHCAFRTLELIHTKQLVLAQANRAIEARDWQITNAMMFNQLHLCATTTPDTATLLASINAHSGAATVGFKRCDIDFLYRAIQLTGVMKAEGLSPAQLLFINLLLLEHPHFLPVALQAHTNATMTECLLAEADADRPAHPPFANTAKPCMLLQTTALRDALEQLRQRLDTRLREEEEQNELGALLHHLNESQRQPTVYRMLEAITPRSRSHERAASHDQPIVNTVFGFTSIYRLATNHQQPSSRTLYELIVREQFASRGSRMSSDESHQPTQWQVIDTSAGGVMVSAPINRFGLPLQPDDLVAFISEPTDEALEIGYIARMELAADDNLRVGICRLARSLETVGFRAFEDQAEGGNYPALLLSGLENQPLLLVEHLQNLHTGDPAFIVRGKQQIPARLGKIVHAKARFMLFEISSPLLERPVQ